MTTNSEMIWGHLLYSGSLAKLYARFSGLPLVVLVLALGLQVDQAGFALVQPEALGQELEPLMGLLESLLLFDVVLKLRLAEHELQRTVIKLVLMVPTLSLVTVESLSTSPVLITATVTTPLLAMAVEEFL